FTNAPFPLGFSSDPSSYLSFLAAGLPAEFFHCLSSTALPPGRLSSIDLAYSYMAATEPFLSGYATPYAAVIVNLFSLWPANRSPGAGVNFFNYPGYATSDGNNN